MCVGGSGAGCLCVCVCAYMLACRVFDGTHINHITSIKPTATRRRTELFLLCATFLCAFVYVVCAANSRCANPTWHLSHLVAVYIVYILSEGAEATRWCGVVVCWIKTAATSEVNARLRSGDSFAQMRHT